MLEGNVSGMMGRLRWEVRPGEVIRAAGSVVKIIEGGKRSWDGGLTNE